MMLLFVSLSTWFGLVNLKGKSLFDLVDGYFEAKLLVFMVDCVCFGSSYKSVWIRFLYH